MDYTGSKTGPAASVMMMAPRRTLMADTLTLASLLAVDLAAETAALDAGRVSETLAAHTLSLANLRPDMIPRLLQRS